MKRAEQYQRYFGRLLGLLLTLLSLSVIAKPGDLIMGHTEQTFPLLETKTGTYTNVTVTKRTKDWVFILHSQGVCNIKATDLSTDARIALGYEAPPKVPPTEMKPGAAKGAAAPEPSAQQSASTAPSLEFSDMKKFAADWGQNRKEREAQMKAYIAANMMILGVALGVLLAVHILNSAILWLICRKTHIAPGILIWVPILQLIPLLRAANMSRWWFFGFFLPGINFIAVILFSIKIVKSRGKSGWVAALLIFPPTSWIAMLYLAFSSSAPVEMASNEVLALETA